MVDTMDSKKLRERIRILERKLGILTETGFACCSITLSQCHALVEIGRAGSLSLNELAELLNLENSTMSRTVNNLVTSGLAERLADAKDRRYVTISLTEEGKRHFEDIEDSMGKYFSKVFSSIEEDKRAQVLESLDLLLEAIDHNECCK